MKQLSRREVIKTFALGSMFSNLIGEAWSAPVLLETTPTPDNQAGMLFLKLADFPELLSARGSTRIGTTALDSGGERQIGLFPPVIINRGDNNEFYTMSAECTHEGCTVRRMDKETKVMTCPCHGSQYAIDGTVVREPARQPLRTLPHRLTNGTLEIVLPDVFYEISAERVPGKSRIAIRFLALPLLTYQLYFRAAVGTPPRKLNFSLSPDGPLSETQVTGSADGNYVMAYVDREGSAGLYQVALKTVVV